MTRARSGAGTGGGAGRSTGGRGHVIGSAAWRATLRLARRDAARRGNRARTALVAAMIGLPVAVVSALTVLASTGSVSQVERLDGDLGLAVARVDPVARVPIAQTPDGLNHDAADGNGLADDELADEAHGTAWTPDEVERAVGGRALPITSGSTAVTVDAGTAPVDAVEVDLNDPVAAASFHLARGRMPTGPGEVAVTRWLSARGPDVGDTVLIGAGRSPRTVTAVLDSRSHDGLIGLPGSLRDTFEGPAAAVGAAATSYLIDRADPVTWAEVLRLNRLGLAVLSREVVEHPPPEGLRYPLYAGFDGSGDGTDAVLVIVVVAVVLEVILLAGPSFAVGVRRQRRQLALVAASGGSPRQVARVVRAQALVIGTGSAALGVALGVGAVVALVRWQTRDDPYATGPLDIVWWQVATVAGLGAAAALVAAWVPSRQASRADVVLELAGRNAPARRRPGHPIVGTALLLLGLALTRAAMGPGGEFMAAWATILLVLAGLAFVPLVVAGVARLGGRLPVPLRLATRDADRHRSRTTPAVAAIMGSVAALTALAIGGFSDQAESRAEYRPELAGYGSMVRGWSLGDDDVWAAVRARAAEIVSGAELDPVGFLTLGTGGPYDETAVYLPTPGCPETSTDRDSEDGCGYAWSIDDEGAYLIEGDSLVAGPAALAALGWGLDAAQRGVLDDGGILVPRRESISPDGTTTLTVTTSTGEAGDDPVTRSVRVPAAVAPTRAGATTPSTPGVVVTPHTVEELGLGWRRDRALLTGVGDLTREQTLSLDEAVRGIGDDLEAYTERGYVDRVTLIIFGVLAGAGVLLVLIGTFTATGLALADSRADLSTLAAIGAAPRTRRVVAAAQSLVIALTGTLTGVAIGFAPGVAVTWPLTADGDGTGPYLDVPWLLLGLIVLVVPLLAAAVTATVTRSRLPVARRPAT